LDSIYLTSAADLLSGVVQGSGNVPMMFLMYINELAKLLEYYGVTLELFADDVKMYLEVRDVKEDRNLQTVLDIIVKWANEWQSQLSVSKCYLLNAGHAPFVARYYIYDSVLPLNTTVGTLEQPSHTTYHLHFIWANSILRCFVSIDINLLMRASVVYVLLSCVVS